MLFTYNGIGESMISLIAHRGNDNKKWLENSITGLVNSINQDYIDGIELDVRMTKDKKIVVIHGLTISDHINDTKMVSTLTLEQIKQYDLDPGKKRVEVATLAEVLKNIHSHKKFIIDIKEEGIGYKEVVRQVHQVLRNYPQLNFYICSFHYPLVSYWKRKYPKDKVGIVIGFLLNTDQFDTDLDFISVNKYYLDKCNFKKETFIWTVNNKKELETILKKTTNVGIITDYASKLYKN